MKAMAGLVVLVTILAGLALPGTANAKSAGDGAFLIESVDSVEGLVRQVEDSRLLVLRYAKHFRVDPSMVLTYFRNELSIEELKEEASLDVYHRKGTSEITSESKKFKAGTKVFVNRNGIPILELGSGNPLADVLPGKDVKKLAPKSTGPTVEQPQPGAKPVGAATPATQTPVQVANQLPTTVPGAETSPLGTQTASAATTGPEVAVLGTGPIETVTKVATRAAGKGLASALSGWVLPAGLAGAALLGAGGGSGGSALPPGGDSGSKSDPPVAVPEPAGILALGTGLMALASYRRIRIR